MGHAQKRVTVRKWANLKMSHLWENGLHLKNVAVKKMGHT